MRLFKCGDIVTGNAIREESSSPAMTAVPNLDNARPMRMPGPKLRNVTLSTD